MDNKEMPVAEAEVTTDDERQSYEFAFHILPTVPEGEVPAVFENLKKMVATAGGDVFDEEAPERFELAYEIVKHLEGRNRKFTSAYFGWIRFNAPAAAAPALAEEVAAQSNILRHLIIRLTRVEQENPFRFHEALANEKKVQTIDEAPEVAEDDKKSDNEETDADDSDDDTDESKASA